MPVAAVSIGGSPRVSSGSTIDHLGIMCGLIIANLRPLVILIREPRPTSEPVPAVVGIAITGATAEVTANPKDGAWLFIRFLTNPDDPSLVGTEDMVFATDVVGLGD